MSSAYETEKSTFMVHLKHSAANGQGVAEEVKTTPLFSLKVKHIAEKTDSSLQDEEDLIESVTQAVKSGKISDGSDDSDIEPTKEDDDSEDGSSDDSEMTSHSSGSTSEATIDPARVPVFTQYSVLGFNIGDHPHIIKDEPILLNTRAPNSTFICGSQHSGKSYTLSCMLEACLLNKAQLGPTTNPLAGVVFHYDVDSTGSVAEAASLCTAGIKVNVLVSRSNFRLLHDAYKALPGAQKNSSVHRLLLKDEHLNVDRMQRLMAVSESENGIPLYMEVIQQILRDMAIAGVRFTFKNFEKRIAAEKLDMKQGSMLKLRMHLLQSCMENFAHQHEKSKETNVFMLEPGTLTIVDLSDPLIDAASVCVLFDICLGVMKQNRPQDGLVVALDEAHRYLNQTAGAANFTESLLTTIREQRHNATRVIIATQEPTLSEKLLDLSSVSIVHRFSSPAWFESIKSHLGAASSLIATKEEQKEMLDRIVNLNTGESLVFSPSSYLCHENGEIMKLGTGVVKMKTRVRSTVDSGRSKMAGE